MSLNFNFTNVVYYQNNYSELYVKYNSFGEEYEDLNPEAKSIVFSTMMIGIGTITKANASEFYGRCKFLEKIDNFYLYSSFDEYDQIVLNYATPEIIQKYVGLITNVSFVSTSEWLKNIYKNQRRFSDSSFAESMPLSDAKTYVKYHNMYYKERCNK